MTNPHLCAGSAHDCDFGFFERTLHKRRTYRCRGERAAWRSGKAGQAYSVSTLAQTTIRSWVRTFKSMSRSRDSSVLPARAEPRFRFIMLFTVSAWYRRL